MADAGDISTWTPTVRVPLASYMDDYPYSGWTQQWRHTVASQSGYGGASQVTARQLLQYVVPSPSTALAWTDETLPSGNLCLMAFDSLALAVIAGDATLAGTNGGLATLLPGQVYSVATNAYCPGWSSALGDLARFRLVTTGTGAGTTYSPAITASGPMTWTFTVPAGATGAYLAAENLTGNPDDMIRFSKPTIHGQLAANTALGYLGGANAVPIQIAQIQMPAYYRKSGWPAPASYLLKDTSALTFIPSTLPGTVGQPVMVDPRSIATAADLRFLASQNYSQASGLWTPWKSTGVHSMGFHAGKAPYYASAADNEAFRYQLNPTQEVSIPSLDFGPWHGTWLYSDDLDALGLTEYTVLMVLCLTNSFDGLGGLWSSAPKATGGGPDTAADASTFNYRVVDASGPVVQLDSPGMLPKSFKIGDAAAVHKPSYLAVTFRNDATLLYYADTPATVLSTQVSLAGVTGPLNGSVVLGADAINGMDSGAFALFEVGIYFSSLTMAQVQREIQLLGQVYN